MAEVVIDADTVCLADSGAPCGILIQRLTPLYRRRGLTRLSERPHPFGDADEGQTEPDRRRRRAAACPAVRRDRRVFFAAVDGRFDRLERKVDDLADVVQGMAKGFPRRFEPDRGAAHTSGAPWRRACMSELTWDDSPVAAFDLVEHKFVDRPGKCVGIMPLRTTQGRWEGHTNSVRGRRRYSEQDEEGSRRSDTLHAVQLRRKGNPSA